MQTTKLLLAFLCANAPVIAAEPGAVPETPKKTFETHFSTLRGRSLQPASGLHHSGGLQKAEGLQPSGPESGAAAAVTRPTAEEEWRRMFPKKPDAK